MENEQATFARYLYIVIEPDCWTSTLAVPQIESKWECPVNGTKGYVQ